MRNISIGIFLFLMLIAPANALAANNTVVLGQIEKLRKSVILKSKKLSKAQLEDINVHLKASIEIALDSEFDRKACLAKAAISLSEEQKIRLCKAGTAETAVCFDAASDRMSVEQRIQLCELGGEPARVTCYDTAPSSMSVEARIQKCTR